MITIIPAIDIIDGKCVRLTQGSYENVKTYHEHPLEVAKEFEAYGITRLHLVDLDGARQKKIGNLNILEKIASQTNLVVDFGGGITSGDDLKQIFNAGATFAVIGSLAVTNPILFRKWITDFGTDKFILAADIKEMKIAISGWQEDTTIDLFEFLDEQMEIGIKNVICTDISKDGMLQGTSVNLYRTIKENFPDFYLIASGGVTHCEEIDRLEELGIDGVIIGKAIYEGKISLSNLVKYK